MERDSGVGVKQVKSHRTVLSTSRHEAAHAVIAERLGCRVMGLHLKTEGQSVLGGTEFDGRSFRRCGPFSMGLMLMAGSVADNVWKTERVGIVSSDDYAALKAMGATSLDYRALYLAVKPLVTQHRAAIERVAHALAKAGRLSGKQLRGILR